MGAACNLASVGAEQVTRAPRNTKERAVMPVNIPSVVARGVDTLVLNVSYYDGHHKPCKRDLPHDLKEQLDGWKQAAIVAEEPIPVSATFDGANLHLDPNGAGKGQWRWLLRCESVKLPVS